MKRQHAVPTILLLVSLLISGCATAPTQPFASISTLPDDLYFRIVGLPHIKITEYRLTHDGILTLTHEEMRPFGRNRQTSRRRVTPEAWQTFQRRIEPLRIMRWKPSYQPRGIIRDGYHWEFLWTRGHTHVESSGSNAGPDPKNPSKKIEGFAGSPSADILLGKALSELWESSTTER